MQDQIGSAAGSSALTYGLAAGVSSGTTISLDHTPPALTKASVLAIGAYTANCEIRKVSSVAGSVVTLSAALNRAHSAGDSVLVVANGVLPEWFGCLGDGATDDWTGLVRCFLEAPPASVPINGNSRTYAVSKPFPCGSHAARDIVIKNTSGLVNPNKASTTVTGSNGLNSATINVGNTTLFVSSGAAMINGVLVTYTGTTSTSLTGCGNHAAYTGGESVDGISTGSLVMPGQTPLSCTGVASTDTFTTASAHTMTSSDATAHTIVCFFAPYGETLPVGVNEGQVYYIKTVPSSTTFTVSDTPGGTTLDLTVDGSCYVCYGVAGLTKLYWDNVRVDVTQAGLNGVIAGVQQDTHIINFRSNCQVDNCIGFDLRGQYSSLHNCMFVHGANNATALHIGGTGHSVTDFNSQGEGIGIDIASADSISLGGVLWTESAGGGAGVGVRLGSSCRAIAFSGTWLTTIGNGGTGATLRVTATNTAYRINSMRCISSGTLLVDDTSRGFQVFADNGSSVTGDSDPGLVLQSYTQQHGNVGPTWGDREVIVAAADKTIRRREKVVLGNGAITLTLPHSQLKGWEVTIKNIHASSVVTLATILSQTINGAAPGTLLPGKSITLVSDGTTSWKTVNDDGLTTNLSATATYDPPSTIDGATWTTTVTVTGATVANSVAQASHASIAAAGWVLYASVTSADTVTVVGLNKTGGTVDLASGTLRVFVQQF